MCKMKYRNVNVVLLVLMMRLLFNLWWNACYNNSVV